MIPRILDRVIHEIGSSLIEQATHIRAESIYPAIQPEPKHIQHRFNATPGFAASYILLRASGTSV